MERSEVGPGGGDDTEQQVNPSSHTSPVCLPPVLCAYSNTWLCHVCCTAGVRRRQMKRQRVTSEPQQIQVSKYRKHRQLKEVFKRYPANSPSQKSKSISWWLLWYWTLNSTKTSKLPCIQFGIIIIKWFQSAAKQEVTWHSESWKQTTYANYYSTDLGCCKGALLNCWKNQYRPEPGFSSRVNCCCSLLANSNSKLTLATLLHIVSLKIRCCRDCCDRFWICIVLLYRHVLEQNS